MVFSPIDFEIKRSGRITPAPRIKAKKEKCVFSVGKGRIELYMDDQLIRGRQYSSKQERSEIIKSWDFLMKNQYHNHTFYVQVIPKQNN
jgi:hypothetical protein